VSDPAAEFVHKGLKAELTCSAHPEQYDVFDGTGRLVGYVRLRHGFFRVDYPSCMGEAVYEKEFDDSRGYFEDDGERAEHLTTGLNALKARIKAEFRKRNR